MMEALIGHWHFPQDGENTLNPTKYVPSDAGFTQDGLKVLAQTPFDLEVIKEGENMYKYEYVIHSAADGDMHITNGPFPLGVETDHFNWPTNQTHWTVSKDMGDKVECVIKCVRARKTCIWYVIMEAIGDVMVYTTKTKAGTIVQKMLKGKSGQ